MLKGILLLLVIFETVTSQTENPIDVQLNNETDAAAAAINAYFGFSCPVGHRCIPVLDCLPCDYGTYKNTTDSALCTRCPPDCTTLRKGAQSKEECVPFCPPGYERSSCGQTCTKCRPGSYKSTWDRDAPCIQCPEDSSPPEDQLALSAVEQCYTDGEDESNMSGPITTITTSMPTSPVNCQELCPLPSSTESSICSEAVSQLFVCLNRCKDNKDSKQELVSALDSVHIDVRNKMINFLNQEQYWEGIFMLFLNECPGLSTTTTVRPGEEYLSPVECAHDKECGVGANCYGGRCGCLTTSCNGVAYSAIPGCQYFCHCNDATKRWEIQTCNSQESFDEMIDNCNWSYNVNHEICYSNSSAILDCQTGSCTNLAPSDTLICSYIVRKYVQCLRSMYVQCGRSPVDEHAKTNGTIDDNVFNEIRELIETAETAEQLEGIYAGYMANCLELAEASTAPPLIESTAGSVVPGFSEDLLSPVECDTDLECGVGANCYGGRCGCLTTSCNGVAYSAIPGCQYFCHCNDATKRWEIQFCNILLSFDEMTDNCDFSYNVNQQICYSNTSAYVDCKTGSCTNFAPSDTLVCSNDVRKYVQCLRSMSVQCGRSPVEEHAKTNGTIDGSVYDVISNLVLTIETVDQMEEIYAEYMTDCLVNGELSP